MFCYSVLTPYYKEDVLYSDEELQKENEDGISILFYLRMIYPGNIFNLFTFYTFGFFRQLANIKEMQMNGPISRIALKN